MTAGAGGGGLPDRSPAGEPVLVSLVGEDRPATTFALSWTSPVERSVLVTAVAVLALESGARRVTASSGAGQAVASGEGVHGPEDLAELLAPLADLLPPRPGFRPLAAEVAVAHRNLDGRRTDRPSTGDGAPGDGWSQVPR